MANHFLPETLSLNLPECNDLTDSTINFNWNEIPSKGWVPVFPCIMLAAFWTHRDFP